MTQSPESADTPVTAATLDEIRPLLSRFDTQLDSLWGATEIVDLSRGLLIQRDAMAGELHAALFLLCERAMQAEENLHRLEGIFQDLAEMVDGPGAAVAQNGRPA